MPSLRVTTSLIAALALAGVPACAQARSLRRGDHGRRVMRLQHELHLHGDGAFGAATLAAVRLFQRHHHLQDDGRVGSQTEQMLRRLAARHQPLHRHTRRPGRRAAAKHAAGSSLPLRIRWATAAASRIAHLPYRYGGGHGSFHDSGYDCSGSISYVLHAARTLKLPLDSSQLERYGAAGHGRWITIYANAGHAFMTIGHHRFDTSGQSATGSRWQRQGRSGAGYTIRHPPGL